MSQEVQYLSAEKVISGFAAVLGDCNIEEIYRGSIEGFGKQASAPGLPCSTAGYFLVTSAGAGGEVVLSFVRSSSNYDAYVKCYRLNDSLPQGIIVRKFTPIDYGPVTDDDTLLPKRLKVKFIKTTAPSQEFWDTFCGSIGYALTEVFRAKGIIAGEYSSAEFDADNHWWRCSLTLELNSSNAKTEHPDLGLALSTARFYIERGTPIRTTDRAGEGTKGTRAVSALPELKGVKFQWSKAG